MNKGTQPVAGVAAGCVPFSVCRASHRAYAAGVRLRAASVGILLAAAVAGGCGSEPRNAGGATAPSDVATSESGTRPGPATMDNPLGAGPLDLGSVDTGASLNAAFVLRDAIFASMSAAGGVHQVVTGGPYDIGIDVAPNEDGWLQGPRRFSWTETGTAREQLQLHHGRVCVNRASADAFAAQGNTAMGSVVGSDLPYSCTDPSGSVGAFVIYGIAGFDPISRVGRLGSPASLTDLGLETDADGVTTRHVQIGATEADGHLRPVATTFDLWLDGDVRLVRAEFTSLAEDGAPYAATFDYGDVPPIELPAAADRGVLGFQPGVGAGSVHPPA